MRARAARVALLHLAKRGRDAFSRSGDKVSISCYWFCGSWDDAGAGEVLVNIVMYRRGRG